ncbi:adenylyltransferase/cytidyltransferase family protein [Desulfovibrio aminophilus]|nr:adenylyltransferase/cytidyltransferase family protein [Desulfovibrio aminophilus]MCM0753900.1 adenylyltransferase/cytidyltransferase family protein [Desulfovibrio aminophilus]
MHRSKVMGLEELARTMAELRGKGVSTGLAHGCFDVLHLGHVRYLARAREHCGFLAVTVTPDAYLNKGPHRPVFSSEQRAEVLAALGMVDAVAVNRWPTAVEALAMLRPAVYFKGRERRAEMDDPSTVMYAESLACRSAGGAVTFIDEIVFSSTSLARRFYSPLLQEEGLLAP